MARRSLTKLDGAFGKQDNPNHIEEIRLCDRSILSKTTQANIRVCSIEEMYVSVCRAINWQFLAFQNQPFDRVFSLLHHPINQVQFRKALALKVAGSVI